MVLNKTWNNVAYPIPQSGERGWASLTNFLSALADGAQTTGKQFLGRRTATTTPVTVTATTDCYVGINVPSAASTVNLPAGVNGQVFIIADESNAGATYNITIVPFGANTINGTTSFVMALDKQVTYLVFNNGNWVVLSTSTASVPITGVTDSATIDFTLLAGVLTAIVIDGSIDNAKIATAAAIARSKIAAGTLSHVVYNDGTTGALSSEAQLDKTRGGTGISSTATFPASGTVVTEDATEILTNKTLTGNTAANLRSGTGSLILNTSGDMTVPNGTDTLVGKSTTDTLANKTLNGAITSNYQQFTNTTVPTTPASGSTRIYASSVDKKFHVVDDAGNDSVVGSGSGGSGGKNYLETYADFALDPSTGMVTNLTTTGNRASNTTVWGANTTALLTQTSTALRGTKSAQIVNGSSTSNFVESPMFALDTIDVNTNQLFVSFDMNSAGSAVAAGDWLVQVIRYNSSGTFQENITPSITNLPSGYYQFKCAFSHSVTAGDQYAIRFRSNSASSRTLTLDTLVVGPQAVVDSAAVGAWAAYTPTFSAGFGTPTNVSGLYRRVGDSMELMVSCTVGTPAASTLTVSLPGSFTIGTMGLSNSSSNPGPIVGQYAMAGVNTGQGFVVTATATSSALLYFGADTAAASTPNTPATGTAALATSTVFTFRCVIPISQWTATVTLAGNPNIEYVSNSSSTDADDTSSFITGATGSAGVIGVTALTALRRKRIRFQSAMQPTDRIQLEISDTTGTHWRPVAQLDGNLNIQPLSVQNSIYYGVGTDTSFNSNTTDLDVSFGTYSAASGATFGAAGSAWNNAGKVGGKWRVAKYSATGLAELAPATALSAGSLSRENNWTAYTPTYAGLGTVSSVSGYYKVVGDTLFIMASCTTGTPTAALASISIPSGFTINSAKIPLTNSTSNSGSLAGEYASNVGGGFGYLVTAPSTSTSLLYFGNIPPATTTMLTPQNGSVVQGGASTLSIKFEVPIV